MGIHTITLLGLALALALAMSSDYEGTPRAMAQTPSPNISISVQGFGCDTNATPPNGTCSLSADEAFTVAVDLTSLTGLPDKDGDTKAGYGNMDISIAADGSVVHLIDRTPGVAEVVGPECGLGVELTAPLPTAYKASCIRGIGANEMTFTGTVFEVDARCVAVGVGEIRLVHGSPSDTHLSDENTSVVIDENHKAVDELLRINCGPVGGVAELPETAGRPMEARRSSHAHTPWVPINALAGGIMLGFAIWFTRALRRRPGSEGNRRHD